MNLAWHVHTVTLFLHEKYTVMLGNVLSVIYIRFLLRSVSSSSVDWLISCQTVFCAFLRLSASRVSGCQANTALDFGRVCKLQTKKRTQNVDNDSVFAGELHSFYCRFDTVDFETARAEAADKVRPAAATDIRVEKPKRKTKHVDALTPLNLRVGMK